MFFAYGARGEGLKSWIVSSFIFSRILFLFLITILSKSAKTIFLCRNFSWSECSLISFEPFASECCYPPPPPPPPAPRIPCCCFFHPPKSSLVPLSSSRWRPDANLSFLYPLPRSQPYSVISFTNERAASYDFIDSKPSPVREVYTEGGINLKSNDLDYNKHHLKTNFAPNYSFKVLWMLVPWMI